MSDDARFFTDCYARRQREPLDAPPHGRCGSPEAPDMRSGRMSCEFGTRFGPAGSASVGPVLLALACACSLQLAGERALADRVEMADGRVLEGRFVLLSGVAI
ncbi:MAG: hypothetical protein EBU23_18580, partial [Mycobacteriaceae bacterium]|nr:hypothetical protein [Mycobacteriaceae bacterium]